MISLTMILQDLHQLHVVVEPPDRTVVGGESSVESHVARVVPHVVTVPVIRHKNNNDIYVLYAH